MAENASKLSMFSGTYRHALDEKHRVTIPARWRQSDHDELFLLPSSDGNYLYALPPSEFQKVNDKLNNDPRITAVQRQQFARYYFSRALHCVIDRQGRLLITDEFLRGAGLEGEALLIGAYERFEIWNPQRWDRASVAESNTFQEVANLIGV